MNYFVTGIDTDVGKTVASAILVEALGADYWKPIQCGFPRDTETVEALVSPGSGRCHPEGVLLQEAASPHQASFNEGVSLKLQDIELPNTANNLIIEGAGGIMVPLNQHQYMLDVAKEFADEIVVVIRMYLGCINHSLLTIDALLARNIRIKGLIFNGTINLHSESVILNRAQSKKLLHVPANSIIDERSIAQWAQELKTNW